MMRIYTGFLHMDVVAPIPKLTELGNSTWRHASIITRTEQCEKERAVEYIASTTVNAASTIPTRENPGEQEKQSYQCPQMQSRP